MTPVVGNRVDVDAPLADPQCRFQRLDHARALGAGKTDPVLDDLQSIAGLRVHARVALALEKLLYLGLRKVPRDGHWEGDDDARIPRGLCSGGEAGIYRIGRIARYAVAASAAEEPGGAPEEELQVIVELRHGAHGRSRGTHRIGLVDGDRGRDAFDRVHLRLVHAVEELPRVRRERLDVAPLALGVERIEYERGLARAGDAGDHYQLVRRQLEREILQIVLARAAYGDGAGRVL